jgi:hypothetical protein
MKIAMYIHFTFIIFLNIMTTEISIEVETQNHGNWIKIFIPYPSSEKMIATLQNVDGEVIKRVKLLSGNNAIDISQIIQSTILLKIESPFETISKKITLNK